MVEAASRIGHRCRWVGPHPERAGLVVGGAQAPMPLRERTGERERRGLPASIVQVLYVAGAPRDGLRQVDCCLVHSLPSLEVGTTELEVDVGARHAELVILEPE